MRLDRGFCVAAFLLVPATAAVAQELAEVCPDSPAGTGALWGGVIDADADMAIPGATVLATWDTEGQTGRAETQTGFDGGFTLCYLPLETLVSVHPLFGNVPGASVEVTLTEPLTRQDIYFSLSGVGSGEGEADRIWACLARGGESTINLQNSRLLRCDPDWEYLERCPHEKIGSVQATVSGAGRGMIREALEKVVDDAKRLGANALIDWQMRGGTVTAEAVLIKVDPATCK